MTDDEGFFARWSRRKAQRRDGEMPPAEPPPVPSARATPGVPAVPAAAAAPVAPAASRPPEAAEPLLIGDPSAPAARAEAHAPPTLADAAKLTPTSDFSRFVAGGVDPSVQHAALKTLFRDPHFNVMDGLDTYIDDYNTPDPIPDAMRRRLLESPAMRRLLDAPQAGAESVAGPANADAATPSTAMPEPAAVRDTAPSEPTPDTDEDTALRLQPDDAADAPGDRPDRPGARA